MPAKKVCEMDKEACFIVVLLIKDEHGEEIIDAQKLVFRYGKISEAKKMAEFMNKSIKTNTKLRYKVMTVDLFEKKYGMTVEQVISARTKRSPGGTCTDELKSCESTRSLCVDSITTFNTAVHQVITTAMSNGCISSKQGSALIDNLTKATAAMRGAKKGR
jgi:hypothetical protein